LSICTGSELRILEGPPVFATAGSWIRSSGGQGKGLTQETVPVPVVVATFYGLLMVILALLLAVGGLALVGYLVPWQVRQRHNDVAGFIYAVLGVVYAVWLGFVTLAVWEDFEVARSTAHSEANELAEHFWLAHELP
jgi:hypothetical protein